MWVEFESHVSKIYWANDGNACEEILGLCPFLQRFDSVANCQNNELTHWDRVTHVCADNLTIIGSDNALSPHRHQVIIWTNGGILLIRTLRSNFSQISTKIHTFLFKKKHLKNVVGGKAVILSWPQCVNGREDDKRIWVDKSHESTIKWISNLNKANRKNGLHCLSYVQRKVG